MRIAKSFDKDVVCGRLLNFDWLLIGRKYAISVGSAKVVSVFVGMHRRQEAAAAGLA